MVSTLLYALFFISCLVLIVTVLLQPGKADAGALFTSNISSTAFGPRGTQSVLSRITIGAALVFMLSGLLLSFQAVSGNISVMQGSSETVTPVTSAIPVSNSANVAVEPTNTTVTNTANTANANK